MPAIDAAPLQPAITIVVIGSREAAHKTPNTVESETASQLRQTVNLRNGEDSLRYLPNLLVRKRHIGDTQAPLATRTSGVGSSARSLVYADGVLLSAIIGNNNSFASPRWGMVSPEEIERVDVLYGSFSAAYRGEFDRSGREHHHPHARGARSFGDSRGGPSALQAISDPRQLSWWSALRHGR